MFRRLVETLQFPRQKCNTRRVCVQEARQKYNTRKVRVQERKGGSERQVGDVQVGIKIVWKDNSFFDNKMGQGVTELSRGPLSGNTSFRLRSVWRHYGFNWFWIQYWNKLVWYIILLHQIEVMHLLDVPIYCTCTVTGDIYLMQLIHPMYQVSVCCSAWYN